MVIASLAVLAIAAAPEPPARDLETVLRDAGPSPERLAAERELAAARRELSLSSGVVLEGPVVAVEAGPRRSPEGDSTDLALELDLPLAADGAARRRALEALRAAEPALRGAADVEGRLALRLAYLEAWEAGEARRSSQQAVEAASGWLEAVEARVAAGADAAYESALVASELGSARLALAEARAREETAWSALGARAAVGERASRLQAPAPPRSVAVDARLERSLVARAVAARAELETALVALAASRSASRWSLRGGAAREGDEDVARLGLGYRLPLPGQRDARTAERDAAVAETARRAEIERATLEGRLVAARARLAELERGATVSPAEVRRALAALDARVEAGKDRPSAILPLRRQLLDALSTELAIRGARLRAAFEIQALTREDP
jgi:hypothetical protein